MYFQVIKILINKELENLWILLLFPKIKDWGVLVKDS